MALRYLTAGESHGPAMNTILEGMPAGLHLTEDMIAADLARRQSGTGSGDRMAIEKDHASILAGVMEQKTTGAPISLLIENKDFANWQGKEVPPYVT
ncbi:MAG: chorismate synthase, partial [Kiritimatiellae bacterium]|nr:chorismate synthase [Kiritimatiellia bacterium]